MSRAKSDTEAEPLPPEPPVPMEGPDTFVAHNLRWLRTTINELISVARDQVFLLRDIRDELVLMRKARENGHGGEPR